MDLKTHQKEVERLIHLSDNSRDSIERGVESLKRQLDVPTRLQHSLKSHPGRWMLGAMAAGLTASRLFGRKSAPQVQKKRSLPLALLGLTLTAVRPIAKVWLADQVRNYMSARLAQPVAKRTHSPSSTLPF
jgi:hypothetical protein